MKPKVSILMPVYNGGEALRTTLRNIRAQSYQDYEMVVNDDSSTDNTEEIVKSFGDPRIKYDRTEHVGYSKNLEKCRQRAIGEILFLMGQDDILARGVLQRTIDAFNDPDVGAVTRAYFWFDDDIRHPVRAVRQLNPEKDEIIRVTDSFDRIADVFHTVGQLSGLALRTKFVDYPIHDDIFTAHIYPFASILKKHPVVFLSGYTLAVQIRTSQCRAVSSIYEKSPVQSWVDMYNTVFNEPEYETLRKRLIRDHAATNYMGLVQLRNYSRFPNLLREIGVLVRNRPMNLVSPAFWFFSLGTIIMPPCLLIPLVDWFKKRIHSLNYRNIDFEYDLGV
jgi:glycosyltransferase involved in cell wall biosynthesis